MVILQLSGYYIQLAENDLTLRKMTTKPSIIIWSILPKDVPVTCKSVFSTSCKIIKMVNYLLLLNTPVTLYYFDATEVTEWQGCVQFRVESTLTHSTQFSFELTFELIFECATL